jgi:hypothetical protein
MAFAKATSFGKEFALSTLLLGATWLLVTSSQFGFAGAIDSRSLTIWTFQVISYLCALSWKALLPRPVSNWLYLLSFALFVVPFVQGFSSQPLIEYIDSQKSWGIGIAVTELLAFAVRFTLTQTGAKFRIVLVVVIQWLLSIVALLLFELMLFAFLLPTVSHTLEGSLSQRNLLLLFSALVFLGVWRWPTESLGLLRKINLFYFVALTTNLLILISVNGFQNVLEDAPGFLILSTVAMFIAGGKAKDALIRT